MFNKTILAKVEILIALAALIVAVFFPVLHAGYLVWDDDVNIFNNPMVRNFNLWPAWREPYYGVYVPLDITFWAILYKLGEGSVLTFRIASLLLHFFNCVLLYRMFCWLQERRGYKASHWAVTAALVVFAVHPLQVEAVAWISGLRDLLAATLTLLAVQFYFSRFRWRYPWASFFFVASLLAKPSVVITPLAVLGIAWILEKERIIFHLKRVAPWLAAAAVLIYVTQRAQSGVILPPIPWWFRPLNVLDSFGFHLQKLFWPWPLATDYGRTPTLILQNRGMIFWTVLTAAIAMAAVWWIGLRDRFLRLSWLWFLLILPVSGIVGFAFQEISTVADRYQYLSMAVVAAMIVLLVRSRVALSLGLAASIVFALAAHSRTYIWADEEKFFLDMYEKNPKSFNAAIGMGNLFFKREDYLSALAWYQKAIAARPLSVVAVSDYAAVLAKMGRHKEVVNLRRIFASVEFQRQVNLNRAPGASLLATLGSSAAILRMWPLALKCVCMSAQLEPGNPEYQKNVQIIEKLMKQKCPAPGKGPAVDSAN